MTYSSIYNTVVTIIAEVLGIEESDITSESHLFNDLGGDSMDAVEIQSQLEEEFDIAIDPVDVESLLVISDIVDYLEANGATVGGSGNSGSNTGGSGNSGSDENNNGGSSTNYLSNYIINPALVNGQEFKTPIDIQYCIHTDADTYVPSGGDKFIEWSIEIDSTTGIDTLCIYKTDLEWAEFDDEYSGPDYDVQHFYRGRRVLDGVQYDCWQRFNYEEPAYDKLYDEDGNEIGKSYIYILTDVITIEKSLPIHLLNYCPNIETMLDTAINNNSWQSITCTIDDLLLMMTGKDSTSITTQANINSSNPNYIQSGITYNYFILYGSSNTAEYQAYTHDVTYLNANYIVGGLGGSSKILTLLLSPTVMKGTLPGKARSSYFITYIKPGSYNTSYPYFNASFPHLILKGPLSVYDEIRTVTTTKQFRYFLPYLIIWKYSTYEGSEFLEPKYIVEGGETTSDQITSITKIASQCIPE